MRKLMLVLVGLVALSTASFAVANGLDGPRTAKGVAGSFSAGAVSTKTRTCQAANGDTISIRFKGTSTFVRVEGAAEAMSVMTIVNVD